MNLSEAVNSTTKFYFEDFRKSNPTLFWIFTVLLIGIVAIIITLIVLFVIFIFTKIFGKGKNGSTDKKEKIDALNVRININNFLLGELRKVIDNENVTFPVEIINKTYKSMEELLQHSRELFEENSKMLKEVQSLGGSKEMPLIEV